MKAISFISVITLILSFNIALSQYIDPQQQKIYTFTDTTYTTKDSILINASLPQFKINNFILGWHWANGKSMTEALGFNQSNIYLKYLSFCNQFLILKSCEL